MHDIDINRWTDTKAHTYYTVAKEWRMDYCRPLSTLDEGTLERESEEKERESESRRSKETTELE